MLRFYKYIFFVLSICYFNSTSAQSFDQRNILNGYSIYENGYIDQPYVVVLNNGDWLCVFTTGSGTESTPGQHIVSSITTDQGKTWSDPIDIEPNTGPAASWATPYLTKFGRIYVFYDYDAIHIDSLDGKPIDHHTEMGWYCYKYSDNNGKSWSKKRYRLPMPKAPVDYNNDFNGRVQLFWGIDKPETLGTSMIFAFTRLGKYKQKDGEGWFYKSNNINTERNPEKIHWELLPDGNRGLRNPEFGSIQEEFNTVPLGNNDIYCSFRTTEGFVANSYSRDGGHSWSLPHATTYIPDGSQVLKNPRACPRVFKCSNGKYLLWFHNNGERGYVARNPVWISGGIEKNGFIYWSQPEILLYSNNLSILGMSYPDLIEQNGQYWFTETQKTKARVHQVNPDLLNGMWNQSTSKRVIKNGMVLEKSDIKKSEKFNMVKLPDLKDGGFSIGMWIKFKDFQLGQIILDSRDESGKGLLITTTDRQSLRLQMSDGKRVESWDSDPGLLTKGKLHHVVLTVDGASNIITVLVDGKLCDGGKIRQYGWGRFSQYLTDINGNSELDVAENLHGEIKSLRLYNRYLTTSEAISNFNAGIIHNY